MNKNMNANNNISTEQVISRYTGNERKVVIPEGVTRIEDGAFKGNKDIVSVDFPLTLTYIGEEAFSGCISLNEIHLAPIESIGKAAFKGCTALEGLSLGGIKFIGDESFMDCTHLRTVVIYNDCEEVGFSAFKNCTSLESVVLPDSVKEICGGAFENCPRLKDLFLPAGENIEDIFHECFKGCTALERRLRSRKEPPTENIAGVIKNDTLIHFDDTYTDCLTIPSYVKYIAAGAFKDCRNLVSITIPDTVEEIEEGAFYDCPNLEEVNIPDDSDIIDQYSLVDTKWYRDNKNGFFILGGTLLGYNGKSKYIIIPPSVKRITDEALVELCLRYNASISLPSTMTEMPDISTDHAADPLVCVYNVNPDSAVR